MNPLQENAHLFVGSYFQVMWPDGTSIWIDGDILMYFEDWENKYPPNCEPKLIARPIEDMTDEEMDEVFQSYKVSMDWQEYLKFAQISDPVEEMERLMITYVPIMMAGLDKGIFPFDQSHFGDTVIDSREVL